MKLFLVLILFFSVLHSFGQESDDCYVKKDFLIITSTKDYQSALSSAQKAAKALEVKLDLRGLINTNDTLIGLSLPSDTCMKYSEDSVCYIARGRWDDGTYISIEYSNAYEAFAKGYYIVVVGSADNKNAELKSTLKKVKIKYRNAYIKTSKVYMCCMH